MKTLQQKIEVMEAAKNGALIELTHLHQNDWVLVIKPSEEIIWDWSTFDYRVVEPIVALGHNPHNLTNEQVETHLGWRLLDTDEIKVRKQSYEEIEAWNNNKKRWNTDEYEGNCEENTYRTKLSREQLAAIDNPPKKRLPLGPEDFPPGTTLRHQINKRHWRSVMGVDDASIYITASGRCIALDYKGDLDECWERSLDGGKTWLPCYREE